MGFGGIPCEKRGLLPHGLLKYFLDSWKDWEFTAVKQVVSGEGLIAPNISKYMCIYIYLELQTTSFYWLFQLDDSK